MTIEEIVGFGVVLLWLIQVFSHTSYLWWFLMVMFGSDVLNIE